MKYISKARLPILLVVLGSALSVLPALADSSYLKPEEVITSVVPGARIEPETIYLTEEERSRAEKLSKEQVSSRLWKRFLAKDSKGLIAAIGFLDPHKVRTSGETLLVIIAPDATIMRIEVVSFFEPPEYKARQQWLDQFKGKRLDDDMQLKRSIQPITGATLTARVATIAARRVLAIHQVVQAREADLKQKRP